MSTLATVALLAIVVGIVVYFVRKRGASPVTKSSFGDVPPLGKFDRDDRERE